MKNQAIHGVAAALALGTVALSAGEESLANYVQEDAAQQWGVKVDYTLASKYMTHGFKVGGDNWSHQPSLTLDTAIEGLQFTYWAAFTDERALNDADEMDFMLTYQKTLNEDSDWAVNVHGLVNYWLYPHQKVDVDRNGAPSNSISNYQGLKMHIGASLPKRISLADGIFLVPSYNIYYWMPTTGDQFDDGFVHELFLSTSIPMNISSCKYVPDHFTLGGSVNYNTGVFGVESGWSHATAHIGTSAPITDSLSWNAGLNYQWTFEDTVNPDGDEFWGQVGVSWSF
ncbi:hypothetical protein [Persicirhabdus sediminis]|uniref:MetA-pathway of phenol degradation n=1 Tax=Persicirhabdus sediminis TaxID=454144 RepID=A0A8J7MGG4_9BACT|nr:hypothetical protein [Persicirhabdus sediminis]MBK1792470.1 hypothetical protein [Persicirhabdus sediminis]